jgi:biopolymer transport protein TolQ
MFIYIAANPFLDAYLLSDIFGKGIFIALIILSIWSWTLLIQKVLETRHVKSQARAFHKQYLEKGSHSLSTEFPKSRHMNPFLDLYTQAKNTSLELLHRRKDAHEHNYLSSCDIDTIQAHLYTTGTSAMQKLEKNLYLLSMIVSLAPFVGLLGTVWGILMTFSELNAHASSSGMHQAVLGGLSLALVTTVLGLLDAIPALMGYCYLKNDLKDFAVEMEGFVTDLISKIEMQYRK